MILTVTIPDALQPYLQAAADAAGQPDLTTAVATHLAGLINDTARKQLTDTAMAAANSQVVQELAAVDAANAQIAVSTS
ncbi:MAG TPA: hypothetical protein VHO91_02190 [Rhodopila sp.]|nr:hypothetical protein [Rhodopila sp.]